LVGLLSLLSLYAFMGIFVIGALILDSKCSLTWRRVVHTGILKNKIKLEVQTDSFYKKVRIIRYLKEYAF